LFSFFPLLTTTYYSTLEAVSNFSILFFLHIIFNFHLYIILYFSIWFSILILIFNFFFIFFIFLIIFLFLYFFRFLLHPNIHIAHIYFILQHTHTHTKTLFSAYLSLHLTTILPNNAKHQLFIFLFFPLSPFSFSTCSFFNFFFFFPLHLFFTHLLIFYFKPLHLQIFKVAPIVLHRVVPVFLLHFNSLSTIQKTFVPMLWRHVTWASHIRSFIISLKT